MVNDTERALWVENDEGLYRWRLSEHKGVYDFVREHRAEIDTAIKRILGDV